MRSRVEIVLKFQQEVYWKTSGACLDRIVEDEIGKIEVGEEVRFARSVYRGRISHTIRSKCAGRECRQNEALGAAWAFPGHVKRSRSLAARSGRANCKRAGLQDGVRAVPVLGQERRSRRPRPDFKFGGRL